MRNAHVVKLGNHYLSIRKQNFYHTQRLRVAINCNPFQELLSLNSGRGEDVTIWKSVSVPFFPLPGKLCCAVFRDWLLLDSVVRLDSAVCNAEQRSLLWGTIFASSQCVLSQGLRYCFHEREAFDWLCLRRSSASGLFFSWDVDKKVYKYLQSFGKSIRKIEFHNCDVVAYLPLVSAHCSNVVCLSFADVKREFSASDVELLSCNLKALDLSGTSITDDLLEQIVMKCPRITNLSIWRCASLSDACGRIIGSNLKNLQYFDISITNLLDTVLLSFAEHNHSAIILSTLHRESQQTIAKI